MEKAGWEIRPSGWILLFVVAAVLTYYILKSLRPPPDQHPANL
jgi:hypothetical protein